MKYGALVFTLALYLAAPAMTHAATLYLDPDQDSFGPGDTFMSEVRLDNDDVCINAGEVVVRYPVDSLRAVDFSRGGSIFSLWVQEPLLDTEKGTVTFSGGVPGGYCGRIPGDPALSNVLGKIVFTVIGKPSKEAAITIDEASSLYLNDGAGTRAELSVRGATILLLDKARLKSNDWLDEVHADTIPPDPFVIEVQSTRNVFSGRYYAVFGTVDKQSGIDHYEIQEKGVWKRVQSPYQLKDQFLQAPVVIRAIDKAGNEQLGDYAPETVPPRQFAFMELFIVASGVLALIVIGALRVYLVSRRRKAGAATSSRV
ncbi:MAG: hypothetical protein KBE09_04510 [Candidatus Pacebacteria bacterium]|nr:hypothetical protein [Candidatus Paceibacterota bacterium]